VRTISLPARAIGSPIASRRLLALAGDERLVAQIRRGSEVAFEVAFERYGPGILAFCRHMLGSREEAEDAVQHTFAAAYRDLLRDEREIRLKAWLYTIARNRCVSMLRARRMEIAGEWEMSTQGLAEQVERRVELRELLRDLGELPEEQRAALLLSEVGDLSHAEVAGVLGCEVQKVKALVFRARSGLIQRRDARETPCDEIREQLASLRGGSPRRSELRHHVKECPGCQDFQAKVRQQRGMLAAALPVIPSLKLKSSVLAAAGIGGGSAGGGAAAGGLTVAAGSLSGGTITKVAIVGALAAGAAAGTVGQKSVEAPVPPSRVADEAAPAPATAAPAPPVVRATLAGPPTAERGSRGASKKAAGQARGNAHERALGRSEADSHAGPVTGPGKSGRGIGRRSENAQPGGGAGAGQAKAHPHPQPRGRGPVEHPPASTPVRRGPPTGQGLKEAVAPKVKAKAPPLVAPPVETDSLGEQKKASKAD
jgi:RNA polymerase sigma factor (sigma-70 family)